MPEQTHASCCLLLPLASAAVRAGRAACQPARAHNHAQPCRTRANPEPCGARTHPEPCGAPRQPPCGAACRLADRDTRGVPRAGAHPRTARLPCVCHTHWHPSRQRAWPLR
jgi:hypothetical protein